MHPSELPGWFLPTLAAVMGALWGSFANVVIYRWPREMSVVLPGSHCFACKTPVAPWDNIPILSYVILRGRCRTCKTKFSPRYAIVELIFGLVGLAIMHRILSEASAEITLNQVLLHFVVRFSVAVMLLIATFIDFDHMLVPWFVKWIAPVPLLAAWGLSRLEPTVTLPNALLGAVVGYFGLRLLFIDGYKLLTGRRGMGLGDAEVLLVVGALLGPFGVLFSLGAGALQGVVFAGLAWALGRRLGPKTVPDDEASEHPVVTDASVSHPDVSADAVAANAVAPASETVPEVRDAESEEEEEFPAGEGFRSVRVPFVPFLTLAALEYLLGADQWIRSYIQWTAGDG